MGTVNSNFLPATTGLSLGSQQQKWLLNGQSPFQIQQIPVAWSATPQFFATGTYNIFSITLAGNVTSSLLTNTQGPGICVFSITQSGGSSFTFAWPPNVNGAVAVNPAHGSITTQAFYFDGTNAWPLTISSADVIDGTGTGSIVLSNSPTLTGTLTAASINASGTLAVTGTSTLTGNASLGGTLAVTGASTLTGNTTHGGIVNSYNGNALSRDGIRSQVGTYSSPGGGLNAALGATTIFTVGTATGTLVFTCYAKVLTAAGTSSTIGPVTVNYTAPDGQNITSTVAGNTGAGSFGTTQGGNSLTSIFHGAPVMFSAKTGTNISVAVGYASSAANAMFYEFQAALELL